MGTIADTYNNGNFINLDMQELVKDYVLQLKDGHGRAYSAILSLETNQISQDTRITALESGAGGEASSSKILGFNVTMSSHGFSNFEAVFFNGSSFVRASQSAGSADGIVIKIDDNNFQLIMAGAVLLDPTLVDDLGAQLVAGDWYFLSDTLGKVQKTKPVSGIFQSLFKVILDHNTVKWAEVNCGQAFVLSTPIKAYFTEGQGYSSAGTFDWTVPSGVFKIKLTCAGAGGGSGGSRFTSGNGGDSYVQKNGLTLMTAFGGEGGKEDGQNASISPNHGSANSGDLNVQGGGSSGGVACMSETGGDNDNIGSDGANGGLAIRFVDVVPGDTIRCVCGAGGTPGNFSSQGVYGRPGIDGYVLIEY